MRTRPWPVLLIPFLGLLFFSELLLHPSQTLYSDYSDLLTLHLPAKHFLVRSWQEHGEVPRWCPYNFAGMPFVHDPQVSAFYPPHLPLFLMPEDQLGAALSWLIVLHVIAAGWCMYAYARYRGLANTGALVAAVGYMFAGKWLLHVLAGGHYNMVPLAWLPLVLLWLEQRDSTDEHRLRELGRGRVWAHRARRLPLRDTLLRALRRDLDARSRLGRSRALEPR